MQINKVQNYNTSFGTYYGADLANRIIMLQNKGLVSAEHLRNFEKIKNDGSECILDVAEKYKIITRSNNKKGSFEKFRFLTLSDFSKKEVVITGMQDMFSPASSNREIFHAHKFLKLFTDEYNLADKIKKAVEKLV